MDTRPRRFVRCCSVLAAGALVASCQAAPAPLESEASEPPNVEHSDGERSEVEQPEVEQPRVPPLLAEIDHLDETVISIATATASDPVRVDAKVAATTDERRRGLMDVPELPDGVGMLFLFDRDVDGGFWMRNTLVPLDIAYIDASGGIVAILAMDPCEAQDDDDCPTYVPEADYRYALEVPQGWFDVQGVAEGDAVTWTEPVPPR